MPARIPAALAVAPADHAAAMAWVKAAHEHGFLFHFDDSPETVITDLNGTPLFHADDLPAIRAAVAAILRLPDDGWGEFADAFGFAISVMDPDMWERTRAEVAAL